MTRRKSLILNKEVISAFELIVDSNTDSLNKSLINTIKENYNKGFLLVKSSEFDNAVLVFNKTDLTLQETFEENSFEYHYCKIFALSTKSYYKFKIEEKEQAILLTKQAIKHAICLQSYKSSFVMGFFVSQMLTNLAQIYLQDRQFNNWYNVSASNVNLLLNNIAPVNFPDFNISSFKAAPKGLRNFTLMITLNETLRNILKYQRVDFQVFLRSLKIENTSSEVIITYVNIWITLNTSISRGDSINKNFLDKCNKFLSLNNEEYDLRMLKLFLKSRIRQKAIA